LPYGWNSLDVLPPAVERTAKSVFMENV